MICVALLFKANEGKNTYDFIQKKINHPKFCNLISRNLVPKLAKKYKGRTFNIDSAEKPLSENWLGCGRQSVAARMVEMAAEILNDIGNSEVRYSIFTATKLGKSGTQVGYYPTCVSACQFINRIHRLMLHAAPRK